MKDKMIFIILDGAADKGIKTPFSEANKPNLDKIASEAFCCLWEGPKAEKGYNPKSMSDIATLEILGYSPKDNPGRGYIEALGIGLKPKKNCVYIRGNFATVKKIGNKFKIIDRRAGREEFGLKDLANSLSMKIEDVKIKCISSLGHRCILILDGNGLSKDVTDSDIGKYARKVFSKNKKAEKTARILNKFLESSYEILSNSEINKKRNYPANFILLRGAGIYKKVEGFEKRYKMKACSIAGHVVIKGISRYLGINSINVRGADASLNTNLEGKVKALKKNLKRYDFLLLHINGCDVAGHEKSFEQKKRFLEKIDNIVFSEIKNMKANIVLTCDHRTPVKTGEHEFGSVPALFYSYKENLSNGIKNFSERECKKGGKIKNVMKFALRLLR